MFQNGSGWIFLCEACDAAIDALDPRPGIDLQALAGSWSVIEADRARLAS